MTEIRQNFRIVPPEVNGIPESPNHVKSAVIPDFEDLELVEGGEVGKTPRS